MVIGVEKKQETRGGSRFIRSGFVISDFVFFSLLIVVGLFLVDGFVSLQIKIRVDRKETCTHINSC